MGGLALFHGVGEYAAHVGSGQRGVEVVRRAHKQVGAHIVADGKVPPGQRWPIDAFADESAVDAGNVGADLGAGPEYLDAWVELAAVDSKLPGVGGIGPRLGVVRRADNQRLYALLFLHEVAVEGVEQCRLAVRVGTGARYVVEEDGELPYAQVVHGSELVEQRIVVGAVPADVAARVYGPDEVDVVLGRALAEFCDFGALGRGVGLAPVRGAVIGVVLGTKDVAVHLIAAHMVEHPQTHLVAPWSAVEALYDATYREFRPVRDILKRRSVWCGTSST